MIATLFASLAIATAQPVTEESAVHGVSFEHARDLQTKPCFEQPTPCIIVFDPAAESWIAELFRITVYDGSLESVAAEQAGFVRREDGSLWTTYGRFMPVRVEALEINGHRALRATNSCGISDPENGFHAGAGVCLTVVISDGNRTAILDSSGYPNGLEAAEAALPSIRVLP